MIKFTDLVEHVLSTQDILLEMPVATSSLQAWTAGIISRIGVVGRKGWSTPESPNAGTRSRRSANQGDTYNSKRYCFDAIANEIVSKLDRGVDKLINQNKITDYQSFKDNSSLIIDTAGFNSAVRDELQDCLDAGISEMSSVNNTFAISTNWFINLGIELVANKLFKFVFKSNVDEPQVSVNDYYGRSATEKPQGVLDFVNLTNSDIEFAKIIYDALDIGDPDNPEDYKPVLREVYSIIDIPYKRSDFNLINTSRLLAQCREGIVTDFPTTHQSER